MIARAVSRWALRALALLALKTVVQIANDKAYQRGNARRSRVPAHPITAKRVGKLTKTARP